MTGTVEQTEETIEPEIDFEEKTEEIIEEKNTEPEEITEKKEQPKIEKETVEIQSENEPVDKKIIGEQFTNEPSLNDRLVRGKQQESKIKGKPVTSLKTAIGLNDKFLYIRELFENNSEKFSNAIDALDKSEGLIKAVEYMEQNFKWSKNETSLKFMELVKKRFEK